MQAVGTKSEEAVSNRIKCFKSNPYIRQKISHVADWEKKVQEILCSRSYTRFKHQLKKLFYLDSIKSEQRKAYINKILKNSAQCSVTTSGEQPPSILRVNKIIDSNPVDSQLKPKEKVEEQIQSETPKPPITPSQID